MFTDSVIILLDFSPFFLWLESRSHRPGNVITWTLNLWEINYRYYPTILSRGTGMAALILSDSGESGVYSWQLWRRKEALESYQIKVRSCLICNVASQLRFWKLHGHSQFTFVLFLILHPFRSLFFVNSCINKNLATACSFTWEQMSFSFPQWGWSVP